MRPLLQPPLVLALAIAYVSASPFAPPFPQLSERQVIETNLTGVDDRSSFVNATGRLKRNCAYWAWYPDDGLAQVRAMEIVLARSRLHLNSPFHVSVWLARYSTDPTRAQCCHDSARGRLRSVRQRGSSHLRPRRSRDALQRLRLPPSSSAGHRW